MSDDLCEAVAAGGLLAPGRPVVSLLSGGRDSVCLLDVAVRISGAVTALHVNYGLRPQADSDQRHCEALCARLGVELRVVRAGPAPASGNLQAWARELRYREAQRAAIDIAAGHTATDQVETILYRLASSPSRRALLGMRERDGRLIRPLLAFTRAQTTTHCAQRGLRWVQDETNDSDVYARGRVRGKLVPALAAVHPAAQRNVLALAEILRQ
ncbi:MAG: tRNA lysidine(34) synthetase TilS, partial [Solirubrobacteraceae bacterium]